MDDERRLEYVRLDYDLWRSNMRKVGLAAFSAIMLIALVSCGTPQPANRQVSQPAARPAQPAQPTSRYFTGDAGRGIRIAVLVPDAVGLPADQSYLPTLVQGVLVGDLARFSAISVLDRQRLESVLAETESGIYQTEEDFGRLGQIANVDYVLTGSITRTGTGHALQIQVVGTGRDNVGVTRASFSGTPTIAEMDNFTGIRSASMELLTQMGVSLTPAARQALGGAVPQQSRNAQTALAQGITAQRGGTEIVALSHYMRATSHEPALAEAASRLNILEANVRSGNIGQDIRNDIEWRRQWVERLREAEAFFVSHLNNIPFYIVYSTDIEHVSTNFANETARFRIRISAIHDAEHFIIVNRVMRTVREGLIATGRAGDWGLSNWPNSSVGTGAWPDQRISNFAVEVELLNSDGRSLGRQNVRLRHGWTSRDIQGGRQNVVPLVTVFGNADFPSVNANLITNRMIFRVNSVDGIPAEAASRQRNVSILTEQDYNRITNVRTNGLDTNNLARFEFGQGSGGQLTMAGVRSPPPNRFVIPHGVVNFTGGTSLSNVTELIFPETITQVSTGALTSIRRVSLPANVNFNISGGFFDERSNGFQHAYTWNNSRAGTYIFSERFLLIQPRGLFQIGRLTINTAGLSEEQRSQLLRSMATVDSQGRRVSLSDWGVDFNGNVVRIGDNALLLEQRVYAYRWTFMP